VRKADITVERVSQLVRRQFLGWEQLRVRPVDVDGWDNATIRLGETMSVRLPTAEHYVEAVEKQQRWLPILAGQLPLPAPQPLAKGPPGCGFPWPWSASRGRGRSTDGSTARRRPRRPSRTY
jgi:aminoglycoside phosphotransferase (APT) family kinase protein